MRRVVMVSHGSFAEGLHSAVKMMTGDREAVYSCGLKDDMSADTFAFVFSSMIQNFNDSDEIILLADILSGSPFTNALNELEKRNLLKNTIILAGMNMPLALTAVIMKDQEIELDELKGQLLSEDYAGMVEFKYDNAEDDDDMI